MKAPTTHILKCKAAIHNPKNDAFSGAPFCKCKAALHLAFAFLFPI